MPHHCRRVSSGGANYSPQRPHPPSKPVPPSSEGRADTGPTAVADAVCAADVPGVGADADGAYRACAKHGEQDVRGREVGVWLEAADARDQGRQRHPGVTDFVLTHSKVGSLGASAQLILVRY